MVIMSEAFSAGLGSGSYGRGKFTVIVTEIFLHITRKLTEKISFSKRSSVLRSTRMFMHVFLSRAVFFQLDVDLVMVGKPALAHDYGPNKRQYLNIKVISGTFNVLT